ncbi:MAG TPA: right-handed parallel beta-helix repeat-containing protein [Actinomycetota bacterium]|nr:right-handed parallel beta-helix repeat-containing protein [Actinomycetota bacterium]
MPFQSGVLNSAVGAGDPKTEYTDGPRNATYQVFQLGSRYYARSGVTGLIDYDGTDAGTVLQAACDNASTIDPGALALTRPVVLVRPGQFNISNVKLGGPFHLKGSGALSTTLFSVANNATAELGLITLKNPTTDKDVEISDLNIHGNSSNQSQALDGINLTQTGAAVTDKRHKIQNCWVQNCKGDGIQVSTRADNTIIFNTRIQQCDAHGIHENGAADLEVRGCTVYGSGLHGINMAVVGFSHIMNTIVGNSGRIDAVTNGGDGFAFGSANCVALACESNDNLRDGVSFTTGQNVYTGTVQDNVRDHIRIAGGDNYVDVGEVYSGTPATGSLVNFISGTRNSVRVGNPIPASTTGAFVTGTVGGNSVDVGSTLAMQNISYATPLTPNPYRGRTIIMTLTGPLTINSTAPNQHAGQRLRFVFLQDGTGGRVPTFNAQYLMPATGPTLAINKSDSIEFEFRSTDGKWVPIGPWVSGV